MKGLQEEGGDNLKFLVIKHGTICEESKTPRDGFEAVQVTNPRTGDSFTKWIKRYRGVEALVCKIEWYEREYDGTRFQGWKLHLDAAGVACALDLPLQSRVTSRFMKLAENIDYERPVEFSAWHDAKTDSTAFNVKQGGASVPQLYTRDNPGDCPEPVKTRLGKWNFDAQTEYLIDRMHEAVIPAVAAAGHAMPEGEARPSAGREMIEQARAGASDEVDDDDIPF